MDSDHTLQIINQVMEDQGLGLMFPILTKLQVSVPATVS
jgi:hypothetical protein